LKSGTGGAQSGDEVWFLGRSLKPPSPPARERSGVWGEAPEKCGFCAVRGLKKIIE